MNRQTPQIHSSDSNRGTARSGQLASGLPGPLGPIPIILLKTWEGDDILSKQVLTLKQCLKKHPASTLGSVSLTGHLYSTPSCNRQVRCLPLGHAHLRIFMWHSYV